MDTIPPLNPENEEAARKCEAVADAAVAAMTWIGEQTDRVREEGPAMIRDFRREAIRVRRLAAAARRPMAVSVFGPSQQGKSYLIASLARKGSNPATIRFGEELRGFNRDINPDGGKESTGLVTRFSIRPIAGLPGMPVACRMLSQTDIVKIVANAFMEDFDRDTVVALTPEKIDETLAKLRAKAAPGPVDRLNDDDVYDLFEYFERYFRNHPTHVALKPTTWREMETLAPRLSIPDRVELFGLLWNGTPTMTRVATSLISALAQLDFPDEAFCPMVAIEPKAKSIIDVETMAKLGKDDGDKVPVATRMGRTAEVPRAVLTAIVAELQLQLAEKPFDFFDHTDLLDFPGARSREKYNAGKAEETAAENLFMLFRRGKVAYLYQRYLEEQELTSMLLCLKDSNQEVRSVPSMVKDWIDSTHGATPEARATQKTALFLVFTMFDKEFVTKGGVSGDAVEHWSIRFDTTIKQYLGLDHDWPRSWTPGKPFANTFWLRNPEVFDKGLLEYDDANREVAFREPDRMATLRKNFLANPDVQAHFADPGVSWDAAMALNDGGIKLIAERLAPVCNPAQKRQQVMGQLAELAKRMAARLEPYHVSGDLDAELAKRRAEARTTGRQLLACAEAQAFGLMLRELQVEAETLADLFRRQTLEAAVGPAAVVGPVGARVAGQSLRADFESLFEDDGPAPEPVPEDNSPRDMADVLAELAVAEWIDGMHRFAARPDVPELFRIDRDSAANLVGQIAVGGRRLKLRETIAERIRAGAGYHEGLADRLVKPVMIAERTINDFVTWLGFDGMAEDARPKAGREQRPVFKRAPAAEDMPALSEAPVAYDAAFYLDWATAFVRLVEDNVRATGGVTVDIAANARLGKLLGDLRGAA
ncbi:MAG: virulence factor SrfC family protein [Rhodospirillales bacterium]